MNDPKRFGKYESYVSSLANNVYTFSVDFRMDFRLKKSDVLALKRGKVKCMDGLTIPSADSGDGF